MEPLRTVSLLLFIFRHIIGVELYLTNEENEDILSYSTETGKLNSYPTSIATSDSAVAPAVICDNIYYSFFADLDWFLFAFNTTSKESTLFENQGVYPAASVSCTSTPGELLAVTIMPSAYYTPTYRLQRVKVIGKASISVDPVGEFEYFDDLNYPIDSIFSFNLKSAEVWACFPQSKKLQIMDTKTGQIKETYSYSNGDDAVPYFTIPQTLSGDSFKGAMISPGTKTSIEFVTITILFTEKRLEVSTDVNGAAYLDSNGEAMAICNDTAYVVVGGIGDKISSFNINTGALTATYDLTSDSKKTAAIACKD